MMSKKRSRITNPEPFTPFAVDSISSKKRIPKPKHHQLENELLPSGATSKILKQALLQQKEIQDEDETENDPTKNRDNDNNGLAFINVKDNKDEEGDLDDFDGFSETQSQFGQWDFEDELYQEDEKLLEAFLSKDDRPQRTLADVIIEKIKEKDAHVSSGVQSVPKLDESIVELYKGVGKLLSKYTAGKIPKAFKHIPSLQSCEDVLYLTEPQKMVSKCDVSSNKDICF